LKIFLIDRNQNIRKEYSNDEFAKMDQVMSDIKAVYQQ